MKGDFLRTDIAVAEFTARELELIRVALGSLWPAKHRDAEVIALWSKIAALAVSLKATNDEEDQPR